MERCQLKGDGGILQVDREAQFEHFVLLAPIHRKVYINLIQVWSSALLGLGFSRWTGSSLLKGMVVAFAPLFLIYGIWAALI